MVVIVPEMAIAILVPVDHSLIWSLGLCIDVYK